MWGGRGGAYRSRIWWRVCHLTFRDLIYRGHGVCAVLEEVSFCLKTLVEVIHSFWLRMEECEKESGYDDLYMCRDD